MTAMRWPPPAELRAPELAAAVPAVARAARPDTRALGLLALGHLVVDMN